MNRGILGRRELLVVVILHAALIITFSSHRAQAEPKEYKGQNDYRKQEEHNDHNETVAWGNLKAEERPGVGPGERGKLDAWTPGTPASEASDRARRVLETAAARKVLPHCHKLGMRELLDDAFRLPASDGAGRSGYVVLPMRNPAGDRFFSALLFREIDEEVVAITVDTSTGELVQTVSAGGEEELVSFDRKKWTECFAVSCSVCIAGCAFTGPLWLKCMAACCGVSAAVCAAVSLQE